MGEGPVLVTGAAGFIGFHVAVRLLGAGIPVVGLDNLNPYYDPALKETRRDRLLQHNRMAFETEDLADRAAIERVFDTHRPSHTVHLAAQAGVRHSLTHPQDYVDANITGFLNILEACRHQGTRHLVYASSSSVYGGNARLPFSVNDSVDHPVSLYAASKKANELMAHSYAHLFEVPSTGLRFFTVYGPWGRPDMAAYIFVRAMFAGEPFRLFNHGNMVRDFTYIDDIVEGVVRLIPEPPGADPDFDRQSPNPASSWAPHRVFNIGNDRGEKLTDMVAHLEALTERKAIIELVEMQPGDVTETWADVAALEAAVGFRPATPLREGLARFVAWYRDYHGV
ncbi:MAG: NAD-dependent epimerase/dehydratase family protein [Pseudomonadota bacterium]